MEIQFSFDILETPPDSCIGLLWPKAPNTHFQRCISVSQDSQFDHPVLALNSDQRAFFRPLSNATTNLVKNIQYKVELGKFPLSKTHFNINQSSHLSLTPDVYECIKTILNKTWDDQNQFLELTIEALAKHFDYIHHDDELNRAELVCTHLQGDCLDINTALMKILKSQSIESAYYIGLFFEAPHFPTQDDWHCWVSTDINGVQDWDIAHHLKRQLSPVRHGLNPVNGLRCALSHGRGTEFLIGGSLFNFSHLGSPFWCLKDGSVVQTSFKAQIESIRSPQEVLC